MSKKILAALIASAFAVTAFAQAPKSDTAPKSPAATEAKKDAAAAPGARADEKKSEKAKAKSKSKSKSKSKGKKPATDAKAKADAKK
jgi:hypothetical protein